MSSITKVPYCPQRLCKRIREKLASYFPDAVYLYAKVNKIRVMAKDLPLVYYCNAFVDIKCICHNSIPTNNKWLHRTF